MTYCPQGFPQGSVSAGDAQQDTHSLLTTKPEEVQGGGCSCSVGTEGAYKLDLEGCAAVQGVQKKAEGGPPSWEQLGQAEGTGGLAADQLQGEGGPGGLEHAVPS